MKTDFDRGTEDKTVRAIVRREGMKFVAVLPEGYHILFMDNHFVTIVHPNKMALYLRLEDEQPEWLEIKFQ